MLEIRILREVLSDRVNTGYLVFIAHCCFVMSKEKRMAFCIGRVNDRSAYSTITINLEPELPDLTSTPQPTATPIPWNPGQTFGEAKSTVTVLYQAIGNFLIWLFVVVVPIFLPFALIGWVLWKFFTRKSKNLMKPDNAS
jgi:hypothetical protein